MLEALPDYLVDLQPHTETGDGTLNYLMLILPMAAAIALSMIIIPAMVRLAPKLGMIDQPDLRKVHEIPIPRVGGIGIVIGTLVPTILMLPMDRSLLAFVIGSLVLFGFGVLDDCKALGHYVKFAGQFISVIIVVYYGDVYVTWLPFMGGEPIASSIGKPFTVIAMVGMINAINHSDGLDGLAGGESLLSLSCIGWFAWLAGGENLLIICLSTMGGLFGFMRFNTYPAKIFMGDSGSQFLGYTLGYLAVELTQDINPALSPALPALILGLPIADIIVVFALRIYRKMNWFSASRNHIHHRLLDLGFYHYESVILVYSIQALLVICAILMPYEPDGLVFGVYIAIVTTLFVFLYLAERAGWYIHRSSASTDTSDFVGVPRRATFLLDAPYIIVFYGVVSFLVTGAFIATDIPPDLTVFSFVLFVAFLLRLLLGYKMRLLSIRFLVYVTIVFIVYLLNTYKPAYLSGVDPWTYGFFGAMAIGIALSIRFSKKARFNTTPMDYLILLSILVMVAVVRKSLVDISVLVIALEALILLYGSELIFSAMKKRWNLFSLAVLAALLIVGVRGSLLHIV